LRIIVLVVLVLVIGTVNFEDENEDEKEQDASVMNHIAKHDFPPIFLKPATSPPIGN